jgi:type IV secretion system protein TrbG
VCMIELQAGEKIVGEPHIGDSVRWNISPAMYGTGEDSTPVIVLKPQIPGLDTNLLVTTDRRAYHIRLMSNPKNILRGWPSITRMTTATVNGSSNSPSNALC